MRDSINADSNFVMAIRFETGVAVASTSPSNLDLFLIVNKNLRKSNFIRKLQPN